MDPGLNVFGEDGAPQAGPAPAVPQPDGPREVRLAMLAYLGTPFTLCVLPLICYLVSRRLPRPGPPPGAAASPGCTPPRR